MTQITKPTDLNKIWADSGDKATPLDSKISTGWTAEIPPRQWFNWLDNRQDRAIAHINQHGISVWDANTMYYAGKSYVQDPATGNIYRCTTTNQGNAPAPGSTFWTVPFADAASAFSQGQADARYLTLGGNLADVPSKSAARANLGVPSAAEVNATIAAQSVRGFIAFNGVTGQVFSARNMSLTKHGAGHYTVNMFGGAYNGTTNYAAVIGGVTQPTWNQGSSQGNGAHNDRKVWVQTRYNSRFEVLSILRTSRMSWTGIGNDANDAHAMAVALSDAPYIAITLYW